MSFSRAKIVTLGIEFCYLYLFLAGPVLAAEVAGTTDAPILEPGKEYHIKTDNEAIGTKSFNVYVPLDYNESRSWPVVFRYKGRDEKYNPVICRAARLMTCDRGAIIVGMGYLKYGEKTTTASEFQDSIKQELNSIVEVKKLLSKHLNIDNDRLFVSGSSAGGWLVSSLLEYKAQPWAGALIFVAGRHPSAAALTNPKSSRAFRGMPIFIGSTLPGDHHGANYKWAMKAKNLYKTRGAIVTFETYDHNAFAHSPLLRDWVRAYIIDSKTDSVREKIAKARKFNRAKPAKINSAKIIKTQIAERLNIPFRKLSRSDLTGITQLSLMGENVSDITYLANFTSLEALDISFTYVDNLEPLLNCKNLRTLNISGTHIEDITPLKNLPRLESLSMWNLWLDRRQINELKQNLPNLKIKDYQWDLYETDSIGRILPKLTVNLN